MTPDFHCPRCRQPLPTEPAALNALNACPACGRWLRVAVFPAAAAEAAQGAVPELVVTEGEATCFYHPARKAVVPCAQCGRFLCALCDLPVGGRHVCPTCLESGVKKGEVAALERSRTRHDLIVWNILALALLPFCWFIAPLMALVAGGWAIVNWRAKPSLVDNTRLRLAWALGLATLLFAGGIVFWAAVFTDGFQIKQTGSIELL